jgi:hypothetical protein
LFENAEVRCLLGLRDEAAEVGLGAFPKVVLFDGAIAEVEQAQAKPELAVRGAFDHVMPFEHHEETVRGALMELQRRSYLSQAQRSLAFAEQIQNRKSTVQSLNFISALRGSVSHSGPLFR